MIELVNDAVAFYDSNGNNLIGVLTLNQFFGLTPAVNRTASPVVYGATTTDPSCQFDPQ